MKKSTISVLLSAMMAVSSLAVAQSAAPTNDVKSGTQGGSGPSASEKAAPGNMPNSRADVKAQTTPEKSGIQGGEGATKSANPNTAMTGTKTVKGPHNMDNMYDKQAADKAKRTKRVNNTPGQKEGKSAN